MSAGINNREQGPMNQNQLDFRKERLKEMIKSLHAGYTVEEVQAEFAKHFGNVSAEEISQAEQSLIDEGMQVEEIQSLCDIHANVFRGSIDQIHPDHAAGFTAGHPIHTLHAENKAMRDLIARLNKGLDAGETTSLLKEASKLLGIDTHYKVKENLYFPYMEKYGISGPPKVMWGVDDEIRAELKAALLDLEQGKPEALRAVFVRLDDMAFKEEQILVPTLVERLTKDEWRKIADETPEFGYFMINPPAAWTGNQGSGVPQAMARDGRVVLPTGDFKAHELAALFNTLPLDVTFVDKDDKVRFFSHGPDRAFPRTVSVLGRNVSNCHPPASVHVVEQIVADLKSGKKDSEDFWIQMGGKLILIRYFAVRDSDGSYLGVLETTQNIAPLKEIAGEKRLMS